MSDNRVMIVNNNLIVHLKIKEYNYIANQKKKSEMMDTSFTLV